MDGVAHVFDVLRPDVLRDQDIGADRQADKDVDKQVDERACRAYRRQRLLAGELPDYNDVRRVEEELEDAGEHERHRKTQDFAQQRAIAHINFITFFSHWRNILSDRLTTAASCGCAAISAG